MTTSGPAPLAACAPLLDDILRAHRARPPPPRFPRPRTVQADLVNFSLLPTGSHLALIIEQVSPSANFSLL